MNPVRILHTADVHFDRENQKQALASLQALLAHGTQNGVDLWVIAGDLFNRAVPNTGAAGFPRLIDILQRMMDLAPIVAVRGTPTHDIDGCYEALEEIKARHAFVPIDPRSPYFLNGDGDIEGDPWSEESPVVRPPARLLILGCGEPSKEWFLAGKEGLGRDEATQAVIAGMRQLLLGLGAIRKQYAALPCLMVYHGAVEGASLANGQTLPPGGLAIGRDDLALVGADYYALGHIHLAQQIGDLPAYYAGSAYPCNWGETDQKSFYSVDLAVDDADTPTPTTGWTDPPKRIPYPHPPRRKLVKELIEDILPEEVNGFQVWVVNRVPKDVPFNNDSVLLLLMEMGALDGSRSTIEIIATETVRAGQIAEAHRLADKLRVYAENSGDKLAEPVLTKAGQLEAEARASGQAPEGLHIRIDRLRLRGAIGVWKGLGLDELDLDLARYDPGLIALVGPNGKGKSTLIENMHPYPKMLTRVGKLQDHFRLKDSYRDLHFTDERTGQQYRALIQIDGANSDGRAEYHLYRDGEPLTKGRKGKKNDDEGEDYIQIVNRLFGSLSLFVRSAFVSQKPPKNHPDLTDATKGEKKALFRELAGLDYQQAYSEAAREKGKALDAQILQQQARAQNIEEQLQAREGKERQLKETEEREAAAKQDLEKIAADLLEARAALEVQRAAVEENNRLRDRIKAAILRQDGLQNDSNNALQAIDAYRRIVGLRPAAEQAVMAYDAAKTEEGKLNEERAQVAAEREQRLAEHRDRSEAAHSEDKRLSAEATILSRKIAEIEAKRAGFIAKIDQIDALLQQKTTCPKCGHRWADREEERRSAIAQTQQAVLDLDVAMNIDLRPKLEDIEKARDAIAYPPDPVLPPIDGYDRQLAVLRANIRTLRIEEQRRILAEAQDAGARMQEAQRRLAELERQAEGAQAERQTLEASIDRKAEVAYETADGRVKDLEEEREQASVIAVTAHSQAGALREQLEELAAKASEHKTLLRALATAELDRADWQYLERACGPDGIQALELDAMGPGIAEVANRLLSAAYGSRFAVEFRTTRIGGAGSKRRQIEDFAIAVLDSEHGSEQLLETLSGGEAVWIKRAIYDAFGIIRDRSTGQRFLTCFQDEADGALDPEARLAYFRMLEAAHLEAGRRHTLVITHSQEAQEMIAQRIMMEDLQAAAEVETVEAAR
jgi:exonuclease SbcC